MAIGMSHSFRRRLAANCDGVAATEFAILAPMVMGALLLMADFGLAITEQVRLQQVVRSGAEFVMAGVADTSELKDLMEAAATGLDSRERDDVSLGGMPLVDAVQSCRCSSSGAVVSCNSTCDANTRPAYVFFDLSAEKTYEALFLSDMDLRAEVRVQTR